MGEPANFSHDLGDTFGERGHLPLQVYEEGVRPPPANDLDCTVRDMSLVEGHGAPRPQGVGTNLVRVEA